MFLCPPSCVHWDRRPDLTVSGAPSPRFVLFVFSSFYLFQCFVSRGKRVRWPRALMPADRGRYPPLAMAIPSLPAGSLVPGLPLPQARRSQEITPPARLWLNARRIAADSCPPAAANPSPWIQSTRHGQECRAMSPESWFLSLVLPSGTVLMYLVGLVHGDSSGAGGSCSGRGGHFQPPAPLLRRRLLRDPVRAPDSLSCPEEASASELSQEGVMPLWRKEHTHTH